MRSNFHNLSLKGISGIISGIISILFIWFIDYLLKDFSSGIGVGMLPISYFEIIIIVVSIAYILLCFSVVVLINKKRRKKAQLYGWELNSKRILIIYTFFLLIGAITTYFALNSGNIKLIIPVSLFLFGISSIVVRSYTNGPSTILGVLFLLTSILSFFLPPFQFLLWGISFGGFLVIYAFVSVKKAK